MFTAADYPTSLRAMWGLHAIVVMMSVMLYPVHVYAGISLNQTRVIFSATEKAHSLTVKNTGPQTYLIQSRVQQAAQNMTSAPFLVTPPLVIIKPNSYQLLRIVPQRLDVPKDRESVFYLSVMAIPAHEQKDNTPMQLSLGLRSVIKLFYRPMGISAPDPSAPCRLRFQRSGEDIRVHNPTPHFQTFGRLTFDHTPYPLGMDSAMIPPLSSRTYSVPRTVTQVEWQIITDYGGLAIPECHQMLASQQEAP